MPKKLNEAQNAELLTWLQSQNVKTVKINRSYADATQAAVLLKKLFPKLVELHNYSKSSNTGLKLNNWETLNHKVLMKIGMQQPKKMLEKLAKGAEGAIDCLLYKIMVRANGNRLKNENAGNEQEEIWTDNDEVLVVNVTKKIGDDIIKVPEKVVLYSRYEQQQREYQQQIELADHLNQKMAHLENIVNVNNEQLEDLRYSLGTAFMRKMVRQNRAYNILFDIRL